MSVLVHCRVLQTAVDLVVSAVVFSIHCGSVALRQDCSNHAFSCWTVILRSACCPHITQVKDFSVSINYDKSYKQFHKSVLFLLDLLLCLQNIFQSLM